MKIKPIRNRKRPSRQRGAASTAINIASGGSVPRSNFLNTHFAGIESSARRTLSYFTYFSGATSASAYKEFKTFVINGPYDPDTALGGNSATGYAKMMGFYSKSYVLGARIKVKIANLTTSATGVSVLPQVIGLTISTNSNSLVTAEQAVTTGLVDYRLVNASPDTYNLELGCNIAKFMDVPDLMDRSDVYGTDVANPNQIVVAHIWNQSLLANVSSLAFTVEIEFDTVFTDPIPFT